MSDQPAELVFDGTRRRASSTRNWFTVYMPTRFMLARRVASNLAVKKEPPDFRFRGQFRMVATYN
jgi:hypothetical protein